MTGLIDFYVNHPFWLWLSVAAAFLAIEVGTGTGWLLWPAASAAAVGVVALLLPTNLPLEIALFAVLTIASTYFARRFLRPALAGPDPDLNDPTLRLLGRPAEVVGCSSTARNGPPRRRARPRARPRPRPGRGSRWWACTGRC